MIKDKRGILRSLIILASALLLIGFVSLSIAQTYDSSALQSELDNLIAELSNQGYSWLADYNITYPYVSVFRENGNDEIARFESIVDENWYKVFLTNLNENESYNVFDLKTGKREKISYEIIQKKIRIDEIRKELNQERGMFKY